MQQSVSLPEKIMIFPNHQYGLTPFIKKSLINKSIIEGP